jgi:hypothetical protein
LMRRAPPTNRTGSTSWRTKAATRPFLALNPNGKIPRNLRPGRPERHAARAVRNGHNPPLSCRRVPASTSGHGLGPAPCGVRSPQASRRRATRLPMASKAAAWLKLDVKPASSRSRSRLRKSRPSKLMMWIGMIRGQSMPRIRLWSPNVSNSVPPPSGRRDNRQIGMIDGRARARSLTDTAGMCVFVWTYGRGKQTFRAHHHPNYGEERRGPGRTVWAYAPIKRRQLYGVQSSCRRSHRGCRNCARTRSTCPAE